MTITVSTADLCAVKAERERIGRANQLNLEEAGWSRAEARRLRFLAALAVHGRIVGDGEAYPAGRRICYLSKEPHD